MRYSIVIHQENGNSVCAECNRYEYNPTVRARTVALIGDVTGRCNSSRLNCAKLIITDAVLVAISEVSL